MNASRYVGPHNTISRCSVQDVQPFHSEGIIIQDHFEVEQLLGKGGFSAVYLVRDKQDGDKQYALKELTDTDRQEKNKFAFECKVLKRLDHPALPHVYSVTENDVGPYMLMDYIEGPNLEVLRRQQIDGRFSLEQVLTLLSPIMDALSYLHSQEPPILHRDVKPANIIVPIASEKSMLVDFGIAKEYTSDSTTTAVRHCSPGYGAPEQYSTGTDLRTDVYGLAATVYALLTGITPVDSLLRVTKIADKSSDPLVPIQEYVPTLPDYVTRAIHRAISISKRERFETVEAFWEALQSPSSEESMTSLSSQGALVESTHNRSALFEKSVKQPQAAESTLQQERTTEPMALPHGASFLSSKAEITLLAFLAIAVVVSVLLGVGYYRMGSQTTTGTQPRIVNSPAATPTLDASYPSIVGPYSGTIHNISSNETTPMSLTGVVQNNNTITGYFIGLHDEGAFTGVLDISRHFLFTVKRNGQLPLFFDGVVKESGDIVGSYCTQDKAGQCVGDYGEWSLTNK